MIQNIPQTTSSIAEELASNGICVSPRFLSKTFTDQIRTDLRFSQKQGDFTLAGIGQGENRKLDTQTRTDETRWLERTTETITQALIWQQVDQLQQSFNRKLFLGLQKFEGHYSCYSNDGFYGRHKDNHHQSNSRKISVIIYLNENWQKSHGGELRIYNKDGHIDIEPLDGTLVCFFSEESEHEVLPSHAERLSFTGWFSQDP